MKEQLNSDRFIFFGHFDLRGQGIHRIEIENLRMGTRDIYRIEEIRCLIYDPEERIAIVCSRRMKDTFYRRYFIPDINYREIHRRQSPAIRAAEMILSQRNN